MVASIARLPPLLAGLVGVLALGWAVVLPLLRYLIRRANAQLLREDRRREDAGTEQGRYDP